MRKMVEFIDEYYDDMSDNVCVGMWKVSEDNQHKVDMINHVFYKNFDEVENPPCLPFWEQYKIKADEEEHRKWIETLPYGLGYYQGEDGEHEEKFKVDDTYDYNIDQLFIGSEWGSYCPRYPKVEEAFSNEIHKLIEEKYPIIAKYFNDDGTNFLIIPFEEMSDEMKVAMLDFFMEIVVLSIAQYTYSWEDIMILGSRDNGKNSLAIKRAEGDHSYYVDLKKKPLIEKLWQWEIQYVLDYIKIKVFNDIEEEDKQKLIYDSKIKRSEDNNSLVVTCNEAMYRKLLVDKENKDRDALREALEEFGMKFSLNFRNKITIYKI